MKRVVIKPDGRYLIYYAPGARRDPPATIVAGTPRE
jgi:hypothetical protein